MTQGTGFFHLSVLPPLACWLLSWDLSPHGLKLIAADPVITSSHSHVQRQERAVDLSVPKRKTYSRIQAANFSGSLIHQGHIHHLFMPTAITGTDNKITKSRMVQVYPLRLERDHLPWAHGRVNIQTIRDAEGTNQSTGCWPVLQNEFTCHLVSDANHKNLTVFFLKNGLLPDIIKKNPRGTGFRYTQILVVKRHHQNLALPSPALSSAFLFIGFILLLVRAWPKERPEADFSWLVWLGSRVSCWSNHCG